MNKSDHRHRRLLRAGGERPDDCRAAEPGYELPPSNPDCHVTQSNGIMPAAMKRISRPNPQVCDGLHGDSTAKDSLLLLRVRAAEIGPERSPWLAAFESGVGGKPVTAAGNRCGRV